MQKNRTQSGIALIEGLLIMVLVAIIGGVIFFVLSQKNQPTDDYSSQPSLTAKQAKPGIDDTSLKAVTQLEALGDTAAKDEMKIEEEMESDHYDNALIDQAAINSLGEVQYEKEIQF